MGPGSITGVVASNRKGAPELPRFNCTDPFCTFSGAVEVVVVVVVVVAVEIFLVLVVVVVLLRIAFNLLLCFEALTGRLDG